MKGFVKSVVATLGLYGALAGVCGCYHYHDVVDPCYPQRYEYQARQNAHAAYAPQVRNGHVLVQTVWNYHFEEGSDKLTPGGQEYLKFLARRRPIPDPLVFVQTAQDVAYIPEKPEEFPAKRAQLDQKRMESVRNFLTAQTGGGHALPFEVMVHNPPDVGIAGAAVEPSLKQMYTSPKGMLPGTPGSSVSGGGGGGGSK